MRAIIFCHPASISGIPSGSDEKVFATVVVLKKSNDNCKSHEPADTGNALGVTRGIFRLCKLFSGYKIPGIIFECEDVEPMTIFYMIPFPPGKWLIRGIP